MDGGLALFDKSMCSCMENIMAASEKSVDVNPDDVTRITAFLDDDLDSKFEDAEDAMSHSESNLTEMMDSVDTTLKQFSSIVASIHMNVARATGTH